MAFPTLRLVCKCGDDNCKTVIVMVRSGSQAFIVIDDGAIQTSIKINQTDAQKLVTFLG